MFSNGPIFYRTLISVQKTMLLYSTVHCSVLKNIIIILYSSHSKLLWLYCLVHIHTYSDCIIRSTFKNTMIVLYSCVVKNTMIVLYSKHSKILWFYCTVVWSKILWLYCTAHIQRYYFEVWFYCTVVRSKILWLYCTLIMQ